MPLSHKQTHQLLQTLGHQPRRQLGQNFLIDGNIVQKSLRLADLQPGERIVEVGPGLGTLTGCMLEHGAHVYAVEFDKRLHQHLAESLQPRFADSFDLLLGDAIDFPLANLPVAALREQALAATATAAAATVAPPEATPSDAASATSPTNAAAVTATQPEPTTQPEQTTLTGDFKIIANLPYAISTPWLEAVLSGPLRPQRFVLMLQKEAAERFVAEHGSKAYGAISIFTASAYRLIGSHAVSRQCFYPIPGVDSVLLALEALPRPQRWPRLARALVRQFFIHRRKQIGSLVRRAIEDAQEQAAKKPSAKERAAAAQTAAAPEMAAAEKALAAGEATTAAGAETAAPLSYAADSAQQQQQQLPQTLQSPQSAPRFRQPPQSAPQTPNRQTLRDDAAAITRNLNNWLGLLEQNGISPEARPETIPLPLWQGLAQSFTNTNEA